MDQAFLLHFCILQAIKTKQCEGREQDHVSISTRQDIIMCAYLILTVQFLPTATPTPIPTVVPSTGETLMSPPPPHTHTR